MRTSSLFIPFESYIRHDFIDTSIIIACNGENICNEIISVNVPDILMKLYDNYYFWDIIHDFLRQRLPL